MPEPMTLLQQLEYARLGENVSTLPQPSNHGWRGFTFHVAEVNLVVAQRDGLHTVPNWQAQSPLQPLPLTHNWVEGMIFLGGKIYTVIDFAHFIGYRPTISHDNANLLLISAERFNSALLVDSPIRLCRFNDAATISTDGYATAHNIPPTPTPTLAPFLGDSVQDGVSTWSVLDVGALIRSEKFINIGSELG